MSGTAREGDAVTVAYLGDLLDVASDRMGFAEVALVAHAVADDARRGVVPQARRMELVGVCSRRGRPPAAHRLTPPQATSR